MITPAKISNKYRWFEPYLKPLRDQARDPLILFCDQHGFAYSSRIKSLESVSEKVETGRFKAWEDIDDLVAHTVIVPTLAAEPQVMEFLKDVFEPVRVQARGATKKAPDVFRFDCTRFIGRLRVSGGVSRLPIHEAPFEVQVKSAFEHAWSVTTHALG